MSKSKLVFMAVLMVVASGLIMVLSEQGVDRSMEQFLSFFVGMLLVSGIFLFLNQFSKKKE
jgi:hypothetical protein